MNGGFRPAITVEARKLVASNVVRATTVVVVVGIGTLAASLDLAANAGNEQVLAQLGDLATDGRWERLVGIAIQITSAAGLLGFGVVMAYVVGREFADGTISGLFALPVTRATIVAAKIAVVLAWTAVVAVLLLATIIAIGVVAGRGMPTDAAIGRLARLVALTMLSGALAIPSAWAATLGRGLLPGIAVAIGLIASTQVLVVAGSGAWYPPVAPALWAIDPSSVSIAQLSLVPITAIATTAATLRTWSRLQLDR